jgi:hypothetical protein
MHQIGAQTVAPFSVVASMYPAAQLALPALSKVGCR